MDLLTFVTKVKELEAIEDNYNAWVVRAPELKMYYKQLSSTDQLIVRGLVLCSPGTCSMIEACSQ